MLAALSFTVDVSLPCEFSLFNALGETQKSSKPGLLLMLPCQMSRSVVLRRMMHMRVANCMPLSNWCVSSCVFSDFCLAPIFQVDPFAPTLLRSALLIPTPSHSVTPLRAAGTVRSLQVLQNYVACPLLIVVSCGCSTRAVWFASLSTEYARTTYLVLLRRRWRRHCSVFSCRVQTAGGDRLCAVQ
jgi:hypothetical protein